VIAVNVYKMLPCLPEFPAVGRSTTLLDPDLGQLFSIYSVTLIEGFILSFTLFMASFSAVLVIQAKERRKAFHESALPHE